MSYRPMTHEDYIKMKYLDGTDEQKEKKKRKKVLVKAAKKVNNIKVVDDDIDLKRMNPDEDDEEFDFAPKEEKPVVAGVIDDRPNELKRRDIDWNRWRTLDPSEAVTERPKIGTSEASTSLNTDSKNNKTQTTGSGDKRPPRDVSDSRKETGTKSNRRHYSDDDLSPPREVNPRKTRTGSDDDLSPPRATQSRKSHKHSRSDKDRDDRRHRDSDRHDRHRYDKRDRSRELSRDKDRHTRSSRH